MPTGRGAAGRLVRRDAASQPQPQPPPRRPAREITWPSWHSHSCLPRASRGLCVFPWVVGPSTISPPGNLRQFVACCLPWEAKTGEDAKQKSPRKKLRSLPLPAAMRTPSPRRACQHQLLPKRIQQTLIKPAAARTSPKPCRGGACPSRSLFSPVFSRGSPTLRLVAQREK